MRTIASIAARALRAIFALWFAFALAQPVTIRECPIQGGVLEQLAPGVSAMDMHEMHGGMHQDREASNASASAGSSQQYGRLIVMDATPHEQAPFHNHERSHCNCIGDSCATLAVALPTFGTFVPAPRAVLEYREHVVAVIRVPNAPDYLLPPATAPPGSISQPA